MRRSHTVATLASVCPALALATSAGAAGETYLFTVNQQASTTSYTAMANAPFTGSMIGNHTALMPGTRTKVTQSLLVCGTFGATQNDAINIPSGSVVVSGNGSNLHPTGSFRVAVVPGAPNGTATVQGLTLNLLGGATVSAPASLNNLTYQGFCAVNPSCLAPFFGPVTLPLGNANLTAATATQAPGPATGTLTPTGPTTFSFSIPLTLNIAASADLAGAPVPVAPQSVPITFAGTITLTGPGAASLTTTIDLDFAPPTVTTPTVLSPVPFTIPAEFPICPNANLLVSLTLTSTTFSFGADANVAAAGTRVPCACDTDGNFTTDVSDIFVFLQRWFANAAGSDFDGSGTTNVQDIFAFLSCWFARTGC